jgi:hypothetical protein
VILAVVQTLLLVVGSVVLFVLQRGQDRTLAVTFLLFSGTVAAGITPLYRALDPLLGGRNVLTLLCDVLMVAGTSTLLWGVAKAVGAARRWMRNVVVASCSVVVVVITLVFTTLDPVPTTTTFMLAVGGQAPAAVYSIAQTTYLGLALGATGVLCVLHVREARTGLDRVGLWALVVGGVLGVVRMVVVAVMDLAHVAGRLDVTHALSLPYDVTTPGAVLLVASGMLLLVVGHRVWQGRRSAALVRALRRLEPVHARLGTDNEYPESDDPATRLSRLIVEVNDGARRHRTPLDAAERAALAEAEAVLATT